jgi:hypothetical protein
MTYNWCLSRYDWQVHAFPTAQSSLQFSEAVCEHSAPNTTLLATDAGRKCMPCQVAVGMVLAARMGDPTWR